MDNMLLVYFPVETLGTQSLLCNNYFDEDNQIYKQLESEHVARMNIAADGSGLHNIFCVYVYSIYNSNLGYIFAEIPNAL